MWGKSGVAHPRIAGMRLRPWQTRGSWQSFLGWLTNSLYENFPTKSSQ